MSNNVYNDQELLLLLNSGAAPNIDDNQELMIVVEQRLIPAIIKLDVDQELFILVHQNINPVPGVTGVFRVDHWLFKANGPVLANAELWVCQQPAAISAGYSVTTQQGVQTVTGQVPSNLAQLYSDPAGLSFKSQPLVPDAFGHIYFYVKGRVSGAVSPSNFLTTSVVLYHR